MRTLVLVALLLAQAPPTKEPTLSEVDRLKLQNVSQRIELAQLRFQAAQREFETARTDLAKLVEALKVDGYTLDLATLTYHKEPVKK